MTIERARDAGVTVALELCGGEQQGKTRLKQDCNKNETKLQQKLNLLLLWPQELRLRDAVDVAGSGIVDTVAGNALQEGAKRLGRRELRVL